MKPENVCTFLGTSCLVYVTPEGLSDVMVIGTCTGAQDGPPTTMLAITGALMGAAGEAAAWCVSCRCLVTEGGMSALLTMVYTLALFFPPLLDLFLGVPDGTSLEALGETDLVWVCLVKVGDRPLHFTALILCTAKVEGHIVCSYSAIMVSLTPKKVVVAKV